MQKSLNSSNTKFQKIQLDNSELELGWNTEMVIKLLQLNIFKGKFLDQIVQFVKKNDIDICQFQEVWGKWEGAKKFDSFEQIKRQIKFEGEIVKTVNPSSEPDTYFGNAIFFKPKFRLADKKIVWLKDFNPEMELIPGVSLIRIPRAALALLFEANGKLFYAINTHLTRTESPIDDPQKLLEAQKLVDFVRELDKEYILSGDFNVKADTEIVKKFDQLGRNLTTEYNIEYTLNPKIHYLNKEIILKKLAVDFIYISKNISLKKFELITQNLSDHYGLFIEFEV